MSIDFVENYDTLSDELIVESINKGNYELLGIIISRHLPKIVYYVNKYCSESEREDIAQEATYALYSALKSFDANKSSFSTFASLCIKRSVISHIKHSKKNIPNEILDSFDEIEIPDSNTPEKIFFDKENLNILKDNIKLDLSVFEYNVLQLFLEGNKYAEIADKLNISEKSVNNALLRIRRKLKDK